MSRRIAMLDEKSLDLMFDIDEGKYCNLQPADCTKVGVRRPQRERGLNMLRARILVGLACTALVVGIPGAVSATAPGQVNPNCFGKGASQIARGEFEGIEGMGQHSSSQANPRAGIGNLVGNDESPFVHQSELADYLGADC